MKIYIKIDASGGYPGGIISHMIKAIKAFHFQINYFYDEDIFVSLAHGSFPWTISHEEKSKK